MFTENSESVLLKPLIKIILKFIGVRILAQRNRLSGRQLISLILENYRKASLFRMEYSGNFNKFFEKLLA